MLTQAFVRVFPSENSCSKLFYTQSFCFSYNPTFGPRHNQLKHFGTTEDANVLALAHTLLPYFLSIFTAVLPKRLYKTHTPCIHYHLRDNTHRLLLWPYTSPCPLSTSWLLFRMVCFPLFPPHPSPQFLGPVSFIRKRPPDFSITQHRSAGKIDVNRILLVSCVSIGITLVQARNKWKPQPPSRVTFVNCGSHLRGKKPILLSTPRKHGASSANVHYSRFTERKTLGRGWNRMKMNLLSRFSTVWWYGLNSVKHD